MAGAGLATGAIATVWAASLMEGDGAEKGHGIGVGALGGGAGI
jgi:hypothetical protein